MAFPSLQIVTGTKSSRRVIVSILSLLILLPFSGCHKFNVNGIKSKLTPSNNRDWKPEVSTMPFAELDGPQYTLRNIRNCNYVTAEDYVVDYYDRQILIDQIRSVDFIVVPFNNTPRLAHTMMSFGFDDGSYLAVSIEVRKERGEKFNALKGFGRKYELIYVLSDERDVIRLRTRHRDSDVYVYPTIASPQQAQALFANVIQRINKLAIEPEFYNSATNNCTTNIVSHVNELSPDKIHYGWKVLLPGFSAEYAYELGLLDNRIPFEDLQAIALVNPLADEHFEDPQFSQLIRSRHDRIDRYLLLQEEREPTLRGPGDQYLEAHLPRRHLRRRR